MKKKLTITHLYPKHMNIYGDLGNIITLVKRCQWRGIGVTVNKIGFKDYLPKDTDIYFMGGGQDKDQMSVFKNLRKKADILTEHIEGGVPFLAICGAYQLLGKYFLTGTGEVIKGIGVLNIETRAQSDEVKKRCIGNVVAKLNSKVVTGSKVNTIVGFENHSGQTYLGEGVEPLADIIKGFGNNLDDDTEGCIYKNVLGTYLHGSFLPKNPHIADYLILKALKRKYKGRIRLERIDDKEELQAHEAILKRYNVM